MIKPTPSRGRVVAGDTPWGKFRVEWDANGKLISESIEIRTPTQPTDTPPTPSILRPGDVLSYAIQAVTGKPAATCGPCAAHVREMNQRGWLWCLRNRETVAEWLVEGAKRRGHTIDKGGALELLAVAVKELKQRRRGDEKHGETSEGVRT